MEKVNGYPISIGLRNKFKNLLWENKKVSKYFLQFFIFFIKVILKFS